MLLQDEGSVHVTVLAVTLMFLKKVRPYRSGILVVYGTVAWHTPPGVPCALRGCTEPLPVHSLLPQAGGAVTTGKFFPSDLISVKNTFTFIIFTSTLLHV